MSEILRRLEMENVLSVKLSDTGQTVLFMEECDNYYYLRLDREEMSKLVGELSEIRDRMT